MKSFVITSALILCLLLLPGISSGQIPNIQINNPLNTDPEEVTIAVSPLEPNVLVAGANITYIYFSNDGGYTWTQQSLSSPYGVWGDPCVIFDATGKAFYAHLSNSPSPGYWIDRIVVQPVHTWDQTFESGAGIGFAPPRKNQDKEWLAADLTNSPYRNNIYIAWTEFDSYGSSYYRDSSRILFSRTTNSGESWSAPVRVSDDGGNCVDEDSTVEGAVPAVGPDGEVYLSWSGPKGIMFDKSTDGGVTFGRDIFVTTQPGGWDFGINGIYRANGMPITACDVSNSPYRGTIYIQWSDQRNGYGNTDLFLIKSTDAGQTWGPVKKVNDDNTIRDQFFSWMTIDQTNGNIYVVFYDRRNTHGSLTDVYVAASYDGGETFRNFRVSTSSFQPLPGVFFGDYTNITANNGVIYPIWMRLDNTKLSVWTAIIHDGTIIKTPVQSDWNLVSVPVTVNEFNPDTLFPTAISPLYGFSDGYKELTTVKNGTGFWLKFNPPDTIRINGSPLTIDTFSVGERWNIIGSISVPVPVSSITSNSPGMVVSPFFDYNGAGYSVADTIKPGKAYWVRASHAGDLILSATPLASSAARITIGANGEQPPPPPASTSGKHLPTEFALRQNYPNPFNPATLIGYQIPDREHVSLKVYNLLGQEIATLVDEVQDPGIRSVRFETANLPSGVYIYQMTAGTFSDTKRMVLLR